MYKRYVERQIRSSFQALNKGDIDPATRKFARAAHFTFPGKSRWALDTRDPTTIREWFTRFAAAGPHFEIIDIWVKGWPWDMRVAVCMEDRIGATYRNDVFQYLRIVRGRIVRDRLYLDTEAVAAFESDS